MLHALVGRRDSAKARLLVVSAVALACAPFVYALLQAPRQGAMPLLEIGFIAGPLALAAWFSCARPLATLVALYVGLAPIDFLLVYSSGITISRLIGIGAVGVLLLQLVVRGSSLRLPRSVLLWVVTFVVMAASVAWAGDQPKALDRLTQTGLPITILVLSALSTCDRTDLRLMLLSVIAGASAISLYAVMNPPTPTSAVDGGMEGRLVVTTGANHIDPNGLAFSLMTPLAIVLSLALSPGDIRRRLAAGAVAALIMLAVLLTESRGGLLSMGVMLLWFVVRARTRLLALAVLAAGAAASLLQGGAWQRLFSDASSNVEGAGRLPIWSIGLAAFREHWLFGNGYGTFSDAYNQVYLFVPHAFYTGWSREAHNLLIASFVELGIFGGALVLYTWWCQFRALRAIPDEDGDGWLRLAMEAAVLGVFTTAMFLDVLVLKPAWVAPILIAVITAVLARERAPDGEGASRPFPSSAKDDRIGLR